MSFFSLIWINKQFILEFKIYWNFWIWIEWLYSYTRFKQFLNSLYLYLGVFELECLNSLCSYLGVFEWETYNGMIISRAGKDSERHAINSLLCIFMLIFYENDSCLTVQTCWILLVSHLAYTLCSVWSVDAPDCDTIWAWWRGYLM